MRMPFATTALNVAGRPSKAGGWAAKALGCWVFALGLPASAMLWWLGQLIAESISLGYVLGLPLAFATALIGTILLLGGRKLRKKGDRAAHSAKLAALRAAASYQHGALTAQDAARVLGVEQAEADELLTELAKQPDEGVDIDVDDHGNITYRFGTTAESDRWTALARQVRIEPGAEPLADTVALGVEERAPTEPTALADPSPDAAASPTSLDQRAEAEALAEIEALAEAEAEAEAKERR